MEDIGSCSNRCWWAFVGFFECKMKTFALIRCPEDISFLKKRVQELRRSEEFNAWNMLNKDSRLLIYFEYISFVATFLRKDFANYKKRHAENAIDENRRFAFGGTVSSFLKTPTAEPYFKSRKEDELWRAFVHQDLADTSVDENEEQEQLKMSRFFINDENEKFTLHNHKFVLEKNFITILVQVHDRLDLLKVLLDSLKSVRGIEKSFLVISLDTLIPEIEEYLKNYVTFCKLAIIHHPFSMAFYKGQFPAESPLDQLTAQKVK
ncbi:unnamed protein product [Oikopleura dioica]|uniref:Alpha-1,6-mannosyl-glycoprotein 2-beta-N-acetylglucosaminyltransferase n=1 Tax=Oikopleura dioica TaxID=34765 RepID=E4Y009_OIKDI|nr:unnamed protein product [Oikopleura dioica]